MDTQCPPPIDLTNKKPDDIVMHFGKVCKSQYRNGAGLTPATEVYKYINPVQSLPQIIISTSSGEPVWKRLKDILLMSRL